MALRMGRRRLTGNTLRGMNINGTRLRKFSRNPKLSGMKTMVGTPFLHEFLVVPLFHNFTLGQDQNARGFLDGRQAVSNNKSGSSHHKVVQSLLNNFFTFRIQRTCGLIQNQNGGISKKSASNTDALPFPSRK